MTKTQVRHEIVGTKATITFFTDEGVNVLSPDVIRSLDVAIAAVEQDTNVRTTVVAAEGKVFLAGADIKAMATFTPDDSRAYAELGQRVFGRIETLPSITVAAINGAVLGGGLEVALACDFRIAVKTAKLGMPETSLGLIPGWGGIDRLSAIVGPTRARRLYLSGLPVTGEEGMPLGLVDEIVNSVEDLEPRVRAFLQMFQRAAPRAVAIAKRSARDHDNTQAFVDCFKNDESREGITAFLEKRPASWMEAPGA